MMHSTHGRVVAGYKARARQRTSPTSRTNRILVLGVLLALLAAGMLLLAQPAHASTTFTVDSTGDYGDVTLGDGKCDIGTIMLIGERCTLRAAIQEANATSGADTIEFDIPRTGVSTIAPASELPTITAPVTINGYSQPGAQPNTKAVGSDAVLKIELSGADVPGADGLEIRGANSTVKGLVVNSWHLGIRIDGSGTTGNKVVGNYLGTDASGKQDLGNSRGIYIVNAPSNVVGGTVAGARNVISGGDGDHGVSIDGAEARGNQIMGNYVGTDASGTLDLGNDVSGINIEDAPNSVIGGATASARNVVSGNGRYGISIFARGTRVMGNYVGIDASGTKDLGNGENGVFVGDAPNNVIGGTTASARNVISANDGNGVYILGADATGNRVVGNYVGTDKDGTAPLGNGDDGVRIYDARNNTVGGTTAGARNVVSGNYDSGVEMGDAATGNKVIGNYLGADASGTKDLGNGDDGVTIYFAPENTVGGTTAEERNIVSGNDRDGVYIEGSNATGNRVVGNYVGTDKNGTAPLGNFAVGVLISGASSNTVGGTQAGAGNVISANGRDLGYEGLAIYGGTATGNRILSNSVYSNGGIGIDLNADGPTANDPGDADTGPNYRQNFPVLSSAKKSAAGTTTVRGKLNSTPNGTFRLQIFSNPKGADEGKTLLGSQIVSTDGSGVVSFVFSTNKAITLGQNVTATATGPGGDTSEFSAASAVVAK